MMNIHIVQNGETVTSIANQYEVTTDRLIQDNGLVSTASLVPGQAIVITYPNQIHVVQEGDSISSIAAAYGITIMQLLQHNTFLSEREYLNVGESLVISYSVNGALATHGFLYSHINRRSLIKTLPLLSYLSIFNYRVTEENKVITYGDDSDIIKLAIDYGTIPILMVSSITPEGLPNVELVYEILLNKELQNKIINDLIDLIKAKGYYGLNVLISRINKTNQQLYVELISKMSSQLRKEGFYFFITINLNLKDTEDGLNQEELDYTVISEFVDGIIFVQYYWGIRPRDPKPINNVTQIKTYLKYVEKLMVPEKIIIGLTLLGYDWVLPYQSNVSKVTSMSLDGVIVLANEVNATIEYDDISQTPYFYYSLFRPYISNDHIVRFIDARSIYSLLEINYEKNFIGSGIWGIMVFNQQMWSIICSESSIIKYLPDNLA